MKKLILTSYASIYRILRSVELLMIVSRWEEVPAVHPATWQGRSGGGWGARARLGGSRLASACEGRCVPARRSAGGGADPAVAAVGGGGGADPGPPSTRSQTMKKLFRSNIVPLKGFPDRSCCLTPVLTDELDSLL